MKVGNSNEENKKGDCTMWCGTRMFENFRWANCKKCIKFFTKFHWWHLISTPSPSSFDSNGPMIGATTSNFNNMPMSMSVFDVPLKKVTKSEMWMM